MKEYTSMVFLFFLLILFSLSSAMDMDSELYTELINSPRQKNKVPKKTIAKAAYYHLEKITGGFLSDDVYYVRLHDDQGNFLASEKVPYKPNEKEIISYCDTLISHIPKPIKVIVRKSTPIKLVLLNWRNNRMHSQEYIDYEKDEKTLENPEEIIENLKNNCDTKDIIDIEIWERGLTQDTKIFHHKILKND